MKKYFFIVILSVLNISLAFADCGPNPGNTIELSGKQTKGTFYLTKKKTNQPFVIINKLQQNVNIRICVNAATNWYTTVLNNQCNDFNYPSGNVKIVSTQGIIDDNYSAGRCDAVALLPPQAKLVLTISRLNATSGTWQIED